jgi:hypothetical protein
MDQALGPANNSPMLLADPTDGRFVVLANRLDAPDFGCALQISGDGGKSWLTVDPVATLPVGADKCYAPEVAFDQSGVLYYLFVGLEGAGNQPMGAFLTTSVDRGRTFSPPGQVLGPRNFGVRMVVDQSRGQNGRLHLAWLHASTDPPLGGFGPPPNPIMSAYSDDGGNTFTTPVQVSGPTGERVVAPALAVGASGVVHIAYYDLEEDQRDYSGLEGPTWEGVWSLVLSTSVDGGRHFRPGTVVDRSVVPYERVMLIFTMPPPSLAAWEGRLCLAWSDARFGDADALVRCSSDEGSTWAETQRLNDDPPGSGLRQFLPRLSFSPEGRLDAAFYDRRRNPENLLNDVFYTFSRDGGQTFAPNLRLTSDPSDSRIGQRYAVPSAQGQVEFGARLALLSKVHGVLAAWADTRNSARGTTGQDIVVASVELPQTGSGWRLPLGAGFLALGVVTVAITTILWSRRASGAHRHRTADSGISTVAPESDD